jgi:hypothetical protein
MDKIINWFLLVIIFVFDPLAISLVIAANFAFSQIRKDPINELTEEDKEWLDTPLVEETLEWDEYGNPTPIIEEEPKQTGVPVMVDPKTGKFYYEEQDTEYKNLDLDGDGVIEEEELQQVLKEADTNNDGFIDEQEAKSANLNPELVNYLNKIKSNLMQIQQQTGLSIDDKELNIKIDETNDLIHKTLIKKDNDNTITYF